MGVLAVVLGASLMAHTLEALGTLQAHLLHKEITEALGCLMMLLLPHKVVEEEQGQLVETEIALEVVMEVMALLVI
jgi:hypothetical protein